MLGRTVLSEQIGENLKYIMGSSLSTDLDRQTLPRVLVEYRQESDRPAIVRSRANEVIGPDVILMERTEPDARTIVEPQSAAFRLFRWHFQPFALPQPQHPAVTALPPLELQ